MRHLSAIACLFLIAPDELPANTDAEAFGRAAQIVRQAADALGGEARLLGLESISFSYEGRVSVPHQGTTIDDLQVFDYRQDVQATFRPLRIRSVTSFGGSAETSFESVSFIDGDQASSQRDIARLLRASPHALVRHLLENPRNVLVVHEGASEYRLAARFHGELVVLHVGKGDGLVQRVVRVFDDVRHGDSAAILEFPEYEPRSGWHVPKSLRSTEAGHLVIDVPYSQYSLARVEPSQVREPTADSVAPSDSPGTPREHGDLKLGNGITLLRNSGGFDYHSLLVETPEGAILIEAPGAVDDGKATLERARSATQSPLRYIAGTHHHDDHSGGMAGAVFEHAHVVVAQAEIPFFRDLLAAKRSFARSAHEPVTDVTIEAVPTGGEREILKRVIAIDAGPSGHSESHLVFYVPDTGLLFQSDMAVFRWDGSVEPARAQTCRLRKVIDERKLVVRTLAGGHGRPGTMEDLDRAIALRDEGCDADASEAISDRQTRLQAR